MYLKRPDPEYATSPRSRANFVLALKLAAGFLAVMWSVFLFDQLLSLGLIRFGLLPGQPSGLVGVLTTPLLHYNLSHISSNTFPILLGGTAMLYLYPHSSLRALPMIYLGSGLAAWTFARPDVHIGASGLLYGILTYVFVAGLLRRDVRSVAASLVIWFLYGSMIWGVLPAGSNVSWELHLCGAVLGVLTALIFHRWDLPPYRRYAWETEEEEDDAGGRQPWRDEWR